MKILLSIKPEYANAIMNGVKTWEFRKKIPVEIRSGSVVVVYSSSPEKMVLGEFTVGRLLMGNLAGGENSRFWKEVEDGAYVTWRSLHSYAGEDFVHAIEVKSVTRYDRPLTLTEFYPSMKRMPQSFCYIDNLKVYKRAVIVDGVIYEPTRTHPYLPSPFYNVEHRICRCCDLQRGGGLECGKAYCMGFLDGGDCGVYLKRYARIELDVIKKLKRGKP